LPCAEALQAQEVREVTMMNNDKLRLALDELLARSVQQPGGVPGVVAMATDRKSNFYRGAAGVLQLGQDAPMAPDSVFAIFSTTKPLTGTLVMQLVE
jgi:methyl acetate hydrolase